MGAASGGGPVPGNRTGASGAAALVVGVVLAVAGCIPASDDGTAYLLNRSGLEGLSVVVVDREGRTTDDGTLVETFVFDTQFVRRELQCLVAADGRFQVLDPDGAVVAAHAFADGPVCEHDTIVLGPDGSLTWDPDAPRVEGVRSG